MKSTAAEHVSENRSYSKSSALEAAKPQRRDSGIRTEKTIQLIRDRGGFDDGAEEVVAVKR